MTIDLINSIALQLNTIFDNPIIYTDYVNQNFQKNSFFINIIKSYQKPCLSNRFKSFNQIEILYTPDNFNNKHKDLLSIGKSLLKNMYRLKFDEVFLYAKNMDFYIQDAKLIFSAEYSFFFDINQNFTKMQKLFLKGKFDG